MNQYARDQKHDRTQGRTLYDKVWDAHVVTQDEDGDALIYIDRHLVHEVSSPQAFAGLIERGASVRRPDAHIAVADHAAPTKMRALIDPESLAARQSARLEENTRKFRIPYIPMGDARHGIVHVIGPELGFTLPGATLVCGDSHTSTHGAFGALAFGIGTSECECVFATQTLRQQKQKRMRIMLEGTMPPGVSVKDVVLALIARIGTGGARGCAVEFAGPAVDAMSMEERMTLCNMSIEASARVGMIAPDETTFRYLKNKPLAPKGALWDAAVAAWRALGTDADATFDQEIAFDVSAVAPHVSWGTTPADCAPVTGRAPDPAEEADPAKRAQMIRSLTYMGLKPGARLSEIAIDKVFIGSCTNSRLEDLRRAARIVEGRRVAEGVSAIVVPGSEAVRAEAEAEGVHRTFLRAGFEWRAPGCSMCVGMNGDTLAPGERAASTSNRNFEGRQGPGGRTHLMGPEMAAAAAVTGRLTDVRALAGEQP